MKKVIMVWIICLIGGMFPHIVHGEGAPHSLEHTMNKEIEEYLGKHTDRVVFRYENLQTGEFVSKGGSIAKSAASTIKLPLALLIIELVKSEEIELGKKLTYRSYHHYGGSGVIQYNEEGTTYTVEDLVHKMLVHSDNIAYIMLREHVGRQKFINYMKELGADYAYPNGKNYTSANDLTLYLKHLYRIKGNSEFAGEVFKWLQNTAYDHGIPQGVKQPVAHKVGMIPMYNISNDTAIVLGESPYALTILTTNYSYYESKKIISELTNLIDRVHREFKPPIIAKPLEVLKNRTLLL
ncbi:serine hydrolase [Pontibacillus marinus]|uniref:Beta-lactamase class A catalytic domain-containing protein n=1 Tax=Pontibacillus marinus BH030004 = DSM 16465 TaxID=1385511 RepID=A0A0A5GAW3_9BACI|nr:serine hydrolase [Pontibacillus marinus]KGX90311.1 hypothetical protein N783_21205 [Pontibacillus marinus BH030004 = DSM 16465]